MDISWKKMLALFFCVCCLCVMLFACSKNTQENFDKIKTNMVLSEVVGILGEPTRVEGISIFGISGKAAIWEDRNTEIDILFLDNKMVVKNFKKVDGSGNQHK